MKILRIIMSIIALESCFYLYSMSKKLGPRYIVAVESFINDDILVAQFINPRTRAIAGVGVQKGKAEILFFRRKGQIPLTDSLLMPGGEENTILVVTAIKKGVTTRLSAVSLQGFHTLGERNSLVIGEDGKAMIKKEYYL